jgi:MFS family permease
MTAAARTERPERRGSLWRHADFMKLWSAETISQFGTQVTFLALPIVAISVLQVSAFEVALLGTIEFLPFILVSIPAGVWVDRLRRRPILIIGDIGRGLSLASIPIAFFFDVLTIWQLYVVGFVNGVLTVFFDVAYQSYLPALVDRNQLVDGNGKLDVSRSGAQLFGPGLAGVLIGRLGAPIAVILDSISFFVSALFLFAIRKHEPTPEPQRDEQGRRPSMRREAMEGLRYVITHPYLRNIAACTGSSNFFSSLVQAIILVYAIRELGMSATTIGFIFSIGSAGFMLGALTAGRIASWLGVGRTILASTFVFGVSWLPVAVAPRDFPEPFFVISICFGGFATDLYTENQLSLRQTITAARLQGRMNASMRFIVWGTMPLGMITGGAIGTAFGLTTAIWVGAIGSLFVFLPILFSPVPGIVRMPEPVDAQRAPEHAPPPGAAPEAEVAIGGTPPFPPAMEGTRLDADPEPGRD